MLFTGTKPAEQKSITTIEEARQAAAQIRWFVEQNLGQNSEAAMHLRRFMAALGKAEGN